MTVLPAAPAGAERTALREELPGPTLVLVPTHEHDWALRDTEYDNGMVLQRFECDGCLAVRFT